ncbi:MAG: hypothetical protein H6721_12395 [Sandaracinus sp.]|nr:hypothetical protein [Sandaracinus sp.]
MSTIATTLISLLASRLSKDPRAFVRALLAEAMRPFGGLGAWAEHVESTRPGWGPDKGWSYPDPRGLHEDDVLILTAGLADAVVNGAYRDAESFDRVWSGIVAHDPSRSPEWNRRASLVREAARIASGMLHASSEASGATL